MSSSSFSLEEEEEEENSCSQSVDLVKPTGLAFSSSTSFRTNNDCVV